MHVFLGFWFKIVTYVSIQNVENFLIEQSIYGDHQTRLQEKRKKLSRTNQNKMALILLHLLLPNIQVECPVLVNVWTLWGRICGSSGS